MMTSRNNEAGSPEFVCQYEGSGRSACAGEPFYKLHEGKRYCVFHFPGEDKRRDFAQALQRRLTNRIFNFRGFWFPSEAQFPRFEFDKCADFRDVTFSAGANFSEAVFHKDAHFSCTKFDRTAMFKGATFNEGAFFSSSKLGGEANFDKVTFGGQVTFAGATFADHVRFAGREKRPLFSLVSSLSLEFTRIEKPEHVVFHTLGLRPDWFVNVDSRKFQFINVEWNWSAVPNPPQVSNFDRLLTLINETRHSILSLLRELKALIWHPKSEETRSSLPTRLFALTCRQLADNAEENHRYEEASRFRYLAMDSWRLERWRGFHFWKLKWWYWLASGYGEKVFRAVVVLVAIFLLSAALYTQVGFIRWEPRLTSAGDVAVATRDETGAPLKLTRALTYSVAVMTFQRPEPRPATTTAQIIVLLETIVGPVQTTLLALAIRRKFMR